MKTADQGQPHHRVANGIKSPHPKKSSGQHTGPSVTKKGALETAEKGKSLAAGNT